MRTVDAALYHFSVFGHPGSSKASVTNTDIQTVSDSPEPPRYFLPIVDHTCKGFQYVEDEKNECTRTRMKDTMKVMT